MNIIMIYVDGFVEAKKYEKNTQINKQTKGRNNKTIFSCNDIFTQKDLTSSDKSNQDHRVFLDEKKPTFTAEKRQFNYSLKEIISHID